MREPAFWWRAPGLVAAMLAPAAAGYGAVAARAFERRGHRADVPVLCVGNLTVGGGGKTSTAIAIARIYLDAGAHPVFLTRGYGGALPGPVRVDLSAHSAADVGDEPLLLARETTTIVGRDRVAGARLAQSLGADVIIMDDGFQNPSLVKDFALLVVDGRRGIGNGRVIPAGPLRAPLSVQLDHADALLVVGGPSGAGDIGPEAERRGLSIFRAHLDPDRSAAARLVGRKMLAFAGIADPEKFFTTLASMGVAATATVSFPDHHRYTVSDAKNLLASADRAGLSLVTTEKDLVRLQGERGLADLSARVTALPISLVFEQEDTVRRLLLDLAPARLSG